VFLDKIPFLAVSLVFGLVALESQRAAMPETQYVGMEDKILIVAHSLWRSCLPAMKRSITKNTMSRPAKILIVWFKSTTGTVQPIINGAWYAFSGRIIRLPWWTWIAFWN
jgi:hypothetical protein